MNSALLQHALLGIRTPGALALLLLLGACTATSDPASAPPIDLRDAGNLADTGAPVNPGADSGTPNFPEPGAPTPPPPGPSRLEVDQSVITFEDVRMGAWAERTIILRNLGQSPVRIDRVSVNQLFDPARQEFKPGGAWLSAGAIIEPMTFQEIRVRYEPADHKVDRAVVEIASNDPALPLATVRVETVNAYADIEAPQAVRFGTVAPGSEARQRVVLTNRGKDPLTIQSIALLGVELFAVEYIRPTTFPLLLPQNGYVAFDVIFSAQDGDTVGDTLVIRSDDPDAPRLDLPVVANGPTPCLSISDSPLAFEAKPFNSRLTRELVLLNCSATRQLSLSAIELADDGQDVFTLGAVPAMPVQLAPLRTLNVQVTARYISTQDVVGALRLASDDPQHLDVLVPLRMQAATN